jgi:FAD:protein FMN transferase
MALPFKLTLPAMGSQFTYKAYPQPHLSEEQVYVIFREAHAEVLRIENKFTDFKPSPFQKINENAGISPCLVDDEILALILKSIEISQLSEGRFDISFASVGHRWREYRKKSLPFPEEERCELEKLIDFRKIEIDQIKKTIYLPHLQMRIGLGGMGKGYAVDQAFTILKKNRLENFYINGSGDIKVHSAQDAPRPWKIGIRNPFNQDPHVYAGMIQLAHHSVSTSGIYVQFNPSTPQDHHIIKKELTQQNCVSATVIHETCLFTDCLGTILITMSPQKGIELLNKLDISGILIDETGKTHLSSLALQQFGK